MTKAKAAKVKVGDRPVLYPDYSEMRYLKDNDNGPVTLELISDWMGFTQDEALAKSHGLTDCLFVDRDNKKVYSLNDIANRPLYMSRVEELVQSLLQLRWEYNGEPMIIGKTGITLNLQHRGVALYLANQDREDGRPQAPHWQKHWPGPVTMESLVVFGISEEDRVVNTMDTCKPRSLTDVLFRSEYFKKISTPSDRKTLSRMTDNCVKLLWKRTARMDNAFAPTRTHAEALDFIEKHPRVLRAVKHIWEEYHSGTDKDGFQVNSRRIGAGYAAAMMYLMAASDSDGDKYWDKVKEGTSSEKQVKFDRWEKAAEFWTLFCSEASDLEVVRDALGQLADTLTGTGGSRSEREAILVKAWAKFKDDEPIDNEDVDLEDLYTTNKETGIRTLSTNPTMGGIDLYEIKEDDEPDDEEEVEERKRQEREEALEKMKNKNKPKPRPKAKRVSSKNGAE